MKKLLFAIVALAMIPGSVLCMEYSSMESKVPNVKFALPNVKSAFQQSPKLPTEKQNLQKKFTLLLQTMAHLRFDCSSENCSIPHQVTTKNK